MSAESPLVVENLSFRYRIRPELALSDVSFELKPGEILLVAGASGCGKTTLIRCVNGLIPRTYKGELQGRIQVHGEDTSHWPLARISQRVGTVLQDPERQILGTKVLLEVAFGLENLAVPRKEILERVEDALHYLNISDLRDRETFRLSGGEKQKVAVAGVLAMKPSVLLLDEPLASLDPASALETLQMVRRLADEGMAVLLIEHRVEDVMRVHPDNVLFMADGRVRYFGRLEGLLSVVSHREIKLPAAMVMQRAAQEPAPAPLRARPAATATRHPLVQLENVTFGYADGPDILKDISLDIRAGDVIGVLGPNGAGKTTLVKHTIGLLKPRTGRVVVNGLDTRRASVAQLAGVVGYVFQSPSHMLFAPSVNEELAFGPKNLDHPAAQIEKEVREALEIVRLEDRGVDSPLALSFGQQKRVSIAAILAMQSRMLVMDEPTAGQDYQNYMDFMDAILEMPAFEAIVFITHDVDLAVSYANRVLLMADGRVQADGPPHEVLSDLTLLEACRLVPTSLLQENLRRVERTGRFLRAEALAHA
ncbi:MAG TPA: ABC transporter ATP-binding protein [Anaerolineales bacterium]|nr:ABC transporter ATP-binding protein [Anaerolineales bacterium]